jgi:hypothetical protein
MGIAAVFAASLLAASGQNLREPGFPAGIRLPEKAHGEAAIAALGARLPEVAAFYGESPRVPAAICSPTGSPASPGG